MGTRLALRPRPCALALALAVTWLALPAGAAGVADADAALARARQSLADGRLYPAERAAREAVAADPERAEAHRLLGEILLRRRKPAEAVVSLERAAALEPDAPGLERALGLARFEAGDFAGARDALVRALEVEPGDTALRLRLGRCELQLGHAEAAAREFERAAEDPAYRQVALYNLGVARELAGEREAAREAYSEAWASHAPGAVGNRAWGRLQALERAEAEARPWTLGFGAGLFYDSDVTRQEIDRTSGEPDGAGELELDASYTLPVGWGVELEARYDFYQSLYFEAHDFDLHSHALGLQAERRLGAGEASLGYLYSLNLLDGDRFLDFHELRPAYGLAPTGWWYGWLSPALRVKRFDEDPRRDAEQGALSLMQLFALGSWDRTLLLLLEGELEDADDRAFDYRGFAASAGIGLPFAIGERIQRLDVRYRLRLRDYSDRSSAPDGRREDLIHSARARLDVPILRRVVLRIEYEFEDATSDVRSADYTDHTIGGLLRFDL